jgi:hypothetical protein
MKHEKVPHGTIHIPEGEEDQLPCDVCGLWYPDDPASSDTHVMTKKELEILDAMREVKEGAREVKDRMRSIIAEDDQGAELQQRLKDLQARWRKLDAEREAAAQERMRMLGHEGS